MCVLLCANPQTRLWLDAVSIRSQRDAVQASGICCTKLENDGVDYETLSESIVQQIPRGPMLREPYWPRDIQGQRFADASLETWKHPLDAITYAWCRLLVLVGLRR
jgi:hypothetical protein